MVLIAEVGQVLIALGFSASVAYWLGIGAYLAVALFVFVTAWLLMFDAARRETLSLTAGNASFTELVIVGLTMCGTALVFGAIWPALPPILAWSAWKRRRGDDDEVARRRPDDSR